MAIYTSKFTGQEIDDKLDEVDNLRTELDELVKEEFIGATGIVIEESSNSKWTRMGNLNAIDAVLHKYGSYVVDPIHKKYARLSESDHSLFADGTEWSGTYGEAMRRFPTLHYKVVHKDNGQNIIYGSEFDLGGHSFEEDWIGIYQGSLVDGKLHSRPNLAVTTNRTMSQFWADAQATGAEFGLVNYFDFCKYNLMHLLAFGDANSDNTMGVGLYNNPSGGNFYNYVTGSTAILGDATGNAPYKENSAYNQVKLFGIEGLAGGSLEFRPNIRFSGVNAIAYEGNIVSNTAEGRVFQRDTNTNLNSSYIKKMAIDDYADFIPLEGGGTSSSYYADGAWSASGGQLLLVGGRSADGSLCGLSASYSVVGFGTVNVNRGARLAFKNPEGYEEVSGADLANLNI